MLSKNVGLCSPKEVFCKNIFMATSFVIAVIWKGPESSSAVEWSLKNCDHSIEHRRAGMADVFCKELHDKYFRFCPVHCGNYSTLQLW